MNNLLDSLDNNVGDVVEADHEEYDDFQGDEGQFNMQSVGGQSSVDDILAKRGLLEDDEEEEEMEQDAESTDEGFINAGSDHDGEDGSNKVISIETVTESNENMDNTNGREIIQDKEENQVEETSVEISINDGDEEMSKNSSSVLDEQVSSTGNLGIDESEEVSDTEESMKNKILDDDVNVDADKEETIGIAMKEENETPSEVTSSIQINDAEIEGLKSALEEQKGFARQAAQEANVASREVRKLRRNVVKLNAELDSAERELDAQRTELERAAVRIEKDRQRAKEEKERTERSHLEELESIMAEHKASTEALVTAHTKQLKDMEERIKRAEEARAKEGGDMTIELSEATARERDTLKKVLALEEEKSTLESQVSSLTNQMITLQSRTDSLQQMLETSCVREREVDDKLDAALSQHARQLSQRKAREAELERNIADLGAALVMSRQKEANESKTMDKKSVSDDSNVQLKEQLDIVQGEVETLTAQIMLERQRSDTLQKELEDISEERAHESSITSERQKQYDKRVSDLMATISSLESSLRSTQNFERSQSGQNTTCLTPIERKLQKETSTLSEELLKVRKKLQSTSTEVLALRNRLRAALNRADAAEKAASIITPPKMGMNDIEKGNQPNKLKRRLAGKVTVPSIRAAVKFDTGRGETKEQVGRIIDVIDNLTVEIGSYFRKDPIARLCFILYLVFLHLWSFCLFIFHAHGSLEPPASVGPSQLLTHSYRQLEQIQESKLQGN